MDNKAQWALVGAAWFLALSVAVLGWLAYRHFAAPPAPAAPEPGLSAPLAAGEKAVCPVSKAEVVVAADTPSALYKGRTFYFAPGKDNQGHDNKTLFLMDPELYLSGVSGLHRRGAETPAPLSPAAH